MSGVISAVGTIAAIAGTGYSIYNGINSANMQRDALAQQKKAQQQATDAANKQQSAAEQANNRANQKSPDVSAILSGAARDSKTGVASTLLTGTGGIDPNQLQLGKNNLLGS